MRCLITDFVSSTAQRLNPASSEPAGSFTARTVKWVHQRIAGDRGGSSAQSCLCEPRDSSKSRILDIPAANGWCPSSTLPPAISFTTSYVPKYTACAGPAVVDQPPPRNPEPPVRTYQHRQLHSKHPSIATANPQSGRLWKPRWSSRCRDRPWRGARFACESSIATSSVRAIDHQFSIAGQDTHL